MSALPPEVEAELRKLHLDRGACFHFTGDGIEGCPVLEILRDAARIGRASLHPVATEELARGLCPECGKDHRWD